MEYNAFLDMKLHAGAEFGIKPRFIPDWLFDFQKSLVEWALVTGRCALFADCGLGKTPMQLVWAQNMALHSDKPVLILTPLAVAAQTVAEGEKFGIECQKSQNGKVESRIVVTNYERLHHFDPANFCAVICDESSILKSFDGSRKNEITDFMRKVPYRLLATATAAPNDYTELGTSSEALGHLGLMDMLNRFFRNDQNNSATRRMYGEAPKWRFKGHAELPFWRWVTSWARACRKPSDLGYDDGPFVLPELVEAVHVVESRSAPDGMLFSIPATRLPEQREERKRTVQERCEKVAELVSHRKDYSLVWCQLNSEGDLLEKLIPESVQVSGSDSDDAKEEKLRAFASGSVNVLVSKPKIGAWGLNFQHCNHVTYFPSHSYEQFYQSVRRCWRFGQKRPVTVDVIMTDGDKAVMDNMTRKSVAAAKMFDMLVGEMNNAIKLSRQAEYTTKEEVPSWL